ncbi:MAG TPA: dihydrofolate reductase family protein [Ktedonobacterales bacterium]|nr:dihydrofolate reductase family protein [Ktedonobacterales bacterium]
MSPPQPLEPLRTMFDTSSLPGVPLPEPLAALYGGGLSFALPGDRPLVLGNFVSTLDGVVELDAPGKLGGGPISGNSRHDRMVMGLLRAVADAVIVGAGTLRSAPGHRWTAAHIAPGYAASYVALRAGLGLPPAPLQVFVTARGEMDLAQPVFRTPDLPVLIVTTDAGYARLRQQTLPSHITVAVGGAERIMAGDVLRQVRATQPGRIYLTEGGPTLMGDFFAERQLDELFLTLAPQVAGRDGASARPGFVAGRALAPDQPTWGDLLSVKRGGSFLFLRYRFAAVG